MGTVVHRFRRVLVTGGAGYVGSVLTPRLLALGHEVTVYDAFFFGRGTLPEGRRGLRVVEGDVRDTSALASAMRGHDAVIHLACISNDPSFELDEGLSTSINYDCFEPMVRAARAAGVRRFVYASSSSVYGVSEAPEVTEEHPLVPLTLYNRFKGLCEPLLLRNRAPGFEGVVVRPATLCGYSPRCRLDLTVNILTNHAVNAGVITIFGGSQLRPNLHVEDMCRVYEALLQAPPEAVDGRTFNAGYQNMSVTDLAEVVRKVVEAELPDRGPIDVRHVESDDLRSYHINSDRIRRVLGFVPALTIEDAVRDLCRAFREGLLPDSLDDDRYYNVRSLKRFEAA